MANRDASESRMVEYGDSLLSAVVQYLTIRVAECVLVRA